MNRTLLAASFFFLTVVGVRADEPIRFARTPALSPDGKTVAFSYLGDLWTVDANGGAARHLTMHEKHDYNPVFSPDGKWIAFSSNRHGQYDVFVVPVKGGRPKRLTFDSADDHVTAWTPDSQTILFMSGREVAVPGQAELFTVSLHGGQAKRISAFEGRDAAYSPTGDMIAYVRGPGKWYRKGYLGSSNDEIWISNADGSNNRRITNHKGQDSYPIWAPDGKHLYYVSDVCGGLANLVRLKIDPERGDLLPGKPAPKQLTKHTHDFVRRARMSANGEAIVYECGFDLWIYSVAAGTSRKLKIEVNADDKANPETIKTFTTGATEFAWAPNEKHVAFVVHGEIFLLPRAGGKAKRLTNHPGFDHGLAWSPDGKKLLFLSDRNGHEDIYLLEADDLDHPDFVYAHRYKVTQITDTPEAETGVNFAPDGSRVAFVRSGKLMTMNPDGTGKRVLVNQGQVIDYEWSPDSKWICVACMDGSFASELFILPSTGATAAEPMRNITRFATFNSGVTWSMTGNRLAFISQRKGTMSGAYVLALQKPGAITIPFNKDIDWDDIHLRVKQPAGVGYNTPECAISPDGSKIAFRAIVDEVEDLWLANTDGGAVTRLTTGNLKPTQIQWSRIFPSQLYFRDASGNLRALAAITPPIGSTIVTPANIVKFTATMPVRQDELFLEMFDQSWRALNEEFYDANFHGANWKQVRTKYRAAVAHCAMKEDLYTLITLMLGELNASHLGISGKLDKAEQPTADLGLILDRRHPGPEWKIAEIVKNGPADRRGLKVKAGEYITAIDDTPLTPNLDTAKLLNDKVGEFVTLTVVSDLAIPGAKRRVEVKGETRTKVTELMYERWIANNAKRVTDLSQGKLGYIHIPSMTEPGLERFVRALYSDNFDKDGIVLDVRYNGGGFTHDQVIHYLVGKEHTIFSHRNGSSGLVLRSFDRKWTKPLVLLINNRSYSDAEIFPHAFRSWGLGKLVGEPTGGQVIGTRQIKLIDGSAFRTPRIGVHTVKGVNMEREGVMPDYVVEPNPDQLARGIDVQLQKAVEVLTDDVAAWRKTRPPATGLTVVPQGGRP